jgi:hypothetical protein
VQCNLEVPAMCELAQVSDLNYRQCGFSQLRLQVDGKGLAPGRVNNQEAGPFRILKPD